MSEVIIFVDDLFPSDSNYVTKNLSDEIIKIADNIGRDIRTIIINGEAITRERIANALPVVKRTTDQEVDEQEDTIIGICLDLVDRRMVGRQPEIFDGEILLERIKQDPDLGAYDVIVYTGTHVEVDQQQLKDKGAKGLVRKPMPRGSEKTYETMANQILRFLP